MARERVESMARNGSGLVVSPRPCSPASPLLLNRLASAAAGALLCRKRRRRESPEYWATTMAADGMAAV